MKKKMKIPKSIEKKRTKQIGMQKYTFTISIELIAVDIRSHGFISFHAVKRDAQFQLLYAILFKSTMFFG